MKLSTTVVLLVLTACSTAKYQGVPPGGKPFEIDERWLQECPQYQKMPGLVNPNDVIKVRASDAASEAYCRKSRSEIITSYRSYRKALGASAPK